jgi:hypothetical protein
MESITYSQYVSKGAERFRQLAAEATSPEIKASYLASAHAAERLAAKVKKYDCDELHVLELVRVISNSDEGAEIKQQMYFRSDLGSRENGA